MKLHINSTDPNDSLSEYLKHQNSTPVDQDAPQKLGLFPPGSTGSPNYMTLPGTPSKPFEVFFQFDDDQPVKMTETRGKFTLELNTYDEPESSFSTEHHTIQFGKDGKKFKIFLKRKP
jgi:hypothetical protein